MAEQKKETYVPPTIVDYGSIAASTFTRAGGQGPKLGDWIPCKLDKNAEYSCTSTGLS